MRRFPVLALLILCACVQAAAAAEAYVLAARWGGYGEGTRVSSTSLREWPMTPREPFTQPTPATIVYRCSRSPVPSSGCETARERVRARSSTPTGSLSALPATSSWPTRATTGSRGSRRSVRISGSGGSGTGDGQFSQSLDIAVDGAGNAYVVESGDNRVQKFRSDGTFLARWGGSGTADWQFRNPHRIAIDDSGSVYVADSMNHRIQKFTSNGTFQMKWEARHRQAPMSLSIAR